MSKSKSKAGSDSTDSVDDIFSQLINQHNSISPGSASIGSDMDSAVTTWIDSGSLLLNMILSNKPDGGWPCGRIVEVFGRESIGKSTLGYVGMRNAQRAGGIVIYCDIERAGNPEFMEMLGVDLKRIITTNEETIEKLFQALENNLNTIIQSGKFKDKPVFIVIDSVTALQTDAELEGGYEFNMNVSLGKARQLGKALKKIIPSLNRANACLYIVNQIRDNVSGYGQSWVLGGGKALPFYASTRLFLEGKERITAKDREAENEYQEAVAAWKKAGGNKSGTVKPEKPKIAETTVGFEIAAYTIKNKVAPPERRAHFRIIFAEGLSDVECYLEYCRKFGIIKKPQGSAHNEIVGFANDIGKFYDTEWMDVISDMEIHDKVVQLLIDKLTIKLRGGNYKVEVEQLDESEKELIKKLKEEADKE